MFKIIPITLNNITVTSGRYVINLWLSKPMIELVLIVTKSINPKAIITEKESNLFLEVTRYPGQR